MTLAKSHNAVARRQENNEHSKDSRFLEPFDPESILKERRHQVIVLVLRFRSRYQPEGTGALI